VKNLYVRNYFNIAEIQDYNVRAAEKYN